MDARGNGDRRPELRAAPQNGGQSPGGGTPPPGRRPRQGRGRLQWNTWGWFGGQIGSSLWLLVLGIVALAQGTVLGAIPIGCCAVVNVVGTLLWWRRDRVTPAAALQWLLAALTIASAAAVATIVEGGLLGADPTTPPGRWVYLYVLIFPALMVQLWAIDRGASGPD